MPVRSQADADLNDEIISGVFRQAPEIDFQTADEAHLRGLPDPQVLAIAARENRVLVIHDRRTMPRHFATFIAGQISSGVIIVSQRLNVRDAIEELCLIGTASDPEDWHDRIATIPL